MPAVAGIEARLRPRCIAEVWLIEGQHTTREELARAVRRAGYVPTRIELAERAPTGDD